MNANAWINDFDTDAHAAFSDAGMADLAQYTAPGGTAVERRVYVNTESQALGDYGQVVAPRTVIAFFLAEGVVVENASVVVGGRTYVVQAIDIDSDKDDGSLQPWIVRNG